MSGNKWVEVLEYPGKRFDVLFTIAAGFLGICSAAIFLKRGKFSHEARQAKKQQEAGQEVTSVGSPLHYGFPLLMLALKNLLLIGLSGVFLMNINDAKDEQAFLFPQRYWCDFAAIGFASFEFLYLSHGGHDLWKNKKAWGSVALKCFGMIGFALVASNGGRQNARVNVVAVPSIACYGVGITFEAWMWIWPMFKQNKDDENKSKNMITELLLSANVLWGAAYLIAFSLGPAFGDLVSTYHTAVWFFILDLVYGVHLNVSTYWGTHKKVLQPMEAGYTAMSVTASALKANP